MLRKVILGRLYDSNTRHNRSLFDYSKVESESKGIYGIYGINLTATYIWITKRDFKICWLFYYQSKSQMTCDIQLK